MCSEDPSNDILVDADSKRFVDLLATLRQPKRGLRRFNSTIAWISSGDGPLGPGFPFLPDEYSRRYFRFLSR